MSRSIFKNWIPPRIDSIVLALEGVDERRRSMGARERDVLGMSFV
jgi:hypothetical protein